MAQFLLVVIPKVQGPRIFYHVSYMYCEYSLKHVDEVTVYYSTFP